MKPLFLSIHCVLLSLLASCSGSTFKGSSSIGQSSSVNKISNQATGVTQKPNGIMDTNSAGQPGEVCPSVIAPVAQQIDPVDRKEVGKVLWQGKTALQSL